MFSECSSVFRDPNVILCSGQKVIYLFIDFKRYPHGWHKQFWALGCLNCWKMIPQVYFATKFCFVLSFFGLVLMKVVLADLKNYWCCCTQGIC